MNIRILGALRYALDGQSIRQAYDAVLSETIVWRHLMDKDALDKFVPVKVEAAIDLAVMIAQRIACYWFGHRWQRDDTVVDVENGRESRYCARCGFEQTSQF